MAGHSKWANIKHQKAANDKKRGRVWSKLIREVTVAAKQGMPDIKVNPRLRLAVEKAQLANMPKDTVDRAIKRASGADCENWDEIRYEGYGPGGTAIIVDCLSDNRNRTASEVRHAFSKHGGNLGTDGSVAYMFSKKGVISFEPGLSEDAIMDAALELGADDVVTNDDGSFDVYTSQETFQEIKDGLEAAGLKPANAEITMEADTSAAVADQELAEKLLKLVDALEELDDVQEVYSNADIAPEILAALDV